MMKNSNGPEFCCGGTRNSPWMVLFFGVGGVLGILSRFIGGPAKNWFEGIGTFGFIAGLVVLLSGIIAERKESELKLKCETK